MDVGYFHRITKDKLDLALGAEKIFDHFENKHSPSKDQDENELKNNNLKLGISKHKKY
jgi:hypothetical protein